jgi:plastocyanin
MAEPIRPGVRYPGMRWTRLAMIFAVLAGLAGPAVVPLAASAGTTPVKRVLADNFRWCKPSAAGCVTEDENHKTRVVVGTRVKWIYNDDQCDAISFCPGHNVKFAHRAKSADVKTDGAIIATRLFKTAGKYSYWCTNHRSQGMTGRIVVVNN